MRMIRRAIGAGAVAALMLVPLSAASASAAESDEDPVKCVTRALVHNTGVYWCFATKPPPP